MPQSAPMGRGAAIETDTSVGTCCAPTMLDTPISGHDPAVVQSLDRHFDHLSDAGGRVPSRQHAAIVWSADIALFPAEVAGGIAEARGVEAAALLDGARPERLGWTFETAEWRAAPRGTGRYA